MMNAYNYYAERIAGVLREHNMIPEEEVGSFAEFVRGAT
jgi:hypothetical protein